MFILIKKMNYKRVVVGYNESLAEAFENAWEEVFSKNYRQHNEKLNFIWQVLNNTQIHIY